MRSLRFLVAATAIAALVSCKKETQTAALRDVGPDSALAASGICTEDQRNELAHQLAAADAALDQAVGPMIQAAVARVDPAPRNDGGTTADGATLPPEAPTSADEGTALRLTGAEDVVVDETKLQPYNEQVLALSQRLNDCLPDAVEEPVDGASLALTDVKPRPPATGGTKPGTTPGLGGATKPGTTPGLGGNHPTTPGTTPGLSSNHPTTPGTTPGLSSNHPTTPGATPGLSNNSGNHPTTPGTTPGLGGNHPPAAPPAAPYHQVLGKLTQQYATGNSGTGTTVPVGTLSFKPLPAATSKADFDSATDHLFGTDKPSQTSAYGFYQFGRDTKKPAVLGRQADIQASDPGFDKYTSLVGNNGAAPKDWNPANNMVYLQGVMHRKEPIFMASSPSEVDTHQGQKRDGSMRPSVTAHEISELKKAGWTYEPLAGGPKDGIHGKWLPPP